jgi:hypothetical protein
MLTFLLLTLAQAPKPEAANMLLAQFDLAAAVTLEEFLRAGKKP